MQLTLVAVLVGFNQSLCPPHLHEAAGQPGGFRPVAAQRKMVLAVRLAKQSMIKVCCLVNLTIMVAGMVFLAILMFGHGGPNVIGILGIISLGLLSVVVGLAWFVVAKLTRDFVVPIQFAQGGACREGWRVLTGLLSRNAGNFILYFLFQILLAIAIAVLVLAVVLLTCCIAGCLFAIPYLGTVLLLPILVFQRSYSIYYLAQYGSEYAVVSGQD